MVSLKFWHISWWRKWVASGGRRKRSNKDTEEVEGPIWRGIWRRSSSVLRSVVRGIRLRLSQGVDRARLSHGVDKSELSTDTLLVSIRKVRGEREEGLTGCSVSRRTVPCTMRRPEQE